MMAKKKQNMVNRNSNDLAVVLQSIIDRLNHIENFVFVQSKLLNTTILRNTAILDILIEKGILTRDEVEKKSDEILKEIKEKAKELTESDNDINFLKHLIELNDDDIGHA